MELETLRAFLGWSLAVNFGFLLLNTIFLVALQNWASRVHARLFGLEETWVRQRYFCYLANYKLAIIVFNLAPWIALHLVGNPA